LTNQIRVSDLDLNSD